MAGSVQNAINQASAGVISARRRVLNICAVGTRSMIRWMAVNPCRGRATQPNTAQLSLCPRVVITPQKRIAVVGNGNIDVGNQTPTRKAGQPIVQNLSGSNGSAEPRIDPAPKKGRASTNPAGNCGAMSQQGGEFRGNVSAPQKLVHLVGCRERKAKPFVGPGTEARQYSNPVKR